MTGRGKNLLRSGVVPASERPREAGSQDDTFRINYCPGANGWGDVALMREVMVWLINYRRRAVEGKGALLAFARAESPAERWLNLAASARPTPLP